MAHYQQDTGAKFPWRCGPCGRQGNGTPAWQAHAASCAQHRAWIAELRKEMHLLFLKDRCPNAPAGQARG